MKKSLNDPTVLELPAYFPENKVEVASPPSSQIPLVSPDDLPNVQFHGQKLQTKILFADDDLDRFIAPLKLTIESSGTENLDIRFWYPQEGDDLTDRITKYQDEGWRPDVIAIDMNMGDSGRSGVEHLKAIRQQKGCAALAVILMTGNDYAALDKGKIEDPPKSKDVSSWLPTAFEQHVESILYGKSIRITFLNRIVEHVTNWQRAARRRAWTNLLQTIAPYLDTVNIDKKAVAEKLTAYMTEELEVEFAFVRWRRADGKYELLAHQKVDCEKEYIRIGEETITLEDMPALELVLKKERVPVNITSLTPEQSGKFKDRLTGFQFLGQGMWLGNKPVGFITLVRNAISEAPAFDDIDRDNLSVLGRLMASVLGTSDRETHIRTHQTALVEFAKSVAEAKDEEQVCRRLGETIHEQLNHDDNNRSKTSVRLLNPRTGDLKRYFFSGLQAQDVLIKITDRKSLYATCVNKNKYFLISNLEKSDYQYSFLDTRTDRTTSIQSILCTPLSIGRHAIGGINLEHIEIGYYHEHDKDFVQSAASLAANAIENIRSTRLLHGMAAFANNFLAKETIELRSELHNLLHDFCGYSVLVDLEIKGNDPWSVSNVYSRFASSNRTSIENNISEIYENSWKKTWVKRLWDEKAWLQGWAYFTDEDFLPVEIAIEDGEKIHQKADAVLWFRTAKDVPPHRALLLMWFLPPPMNNERVNLLGQMAQLFSTLDEQNKQVKEMIEDRIIGEQAREIGLVFQHFRHRLGSLTGALGNHLKEIRLQNEECHNNICFQKITDLENTVKNIANTFQKDKAYIKSPVFSNASLSSIILSVCRELEVREKLTGINIQVDIPAELNIYTDREIASLVFYSLFENAMEALAKVQEPQISILLVSESDSALTVAFEDNGQGVAQSIQEKLFQWGTTSKTHGLGSALAFARSRMRKVLRGDLTFPHDKQPNRGARFEISFPRHP